MRLLCSLLLALSCAQSAASQERTVRIGVLGMFHPQLLTIANDKDQDLVVFADKRQLFLRPRSSCSKMELRAAGDQLLLRCGRIQVRTQELHAAGRNQEATGLVVAIPGQIERRYEGVLSVRVRNGEIIPVVQMDLETAVASVVQAESMPDTPPEALKAQAVVSRSYLVAGRGRHANFDFCDLTHCQFLREPPVPESPAAQAADATRGLVLSYDDEPILAMFTSSCAGTTLVPAGIDSLSIRYPYYSVRCEICSNDPVRWTRTLSKEDAVTLSSQGEAGRIVIGRKLGWDAVPSYTFTTREQGDEVILEGVGQGHGIGLCQRGARSMAGFGSDFRVILSHYFPNTKLEPLPSK
ncbi:MAG TPA: SpoIID/LytB domain-containing protein [Candidatus Acidoferrum sp.]|nr:SpoIID/LytB domain-containing protein [Candidatus Acidoferrum sp.]